MSKPDLKTPVDDLLSLLEALPTWHTAHAADIKDGLEDHRDLTAELPAAFAALYDAQEKFKREHKEDHAASIELSLLLRDGRALLTSASKAITAAFRDHPERVRMTRQFITRAPSTLRDVNPMLAALELLIGGLTAHPEHFSTRKALYDRLLARAQALRPRLTDANKKRKRELQETRAAAVDRDLQQAAALALITDIDDAAQAVYFDAPAPYNTLRTLYTIHCPEAPTPAGEDDLPQIEDNLPQTEDDPTT